MPELPEVETYVRDLEPLLQGRTVVETVIPWSGTIADPTPEQFAGEMAGRSFQRFGRRGKYMLLGLENGRCLIVHLRMTGELRLHPHSIQPDKHTHVLFRLDDSSRLHYRDMRKFGRMWLVDDPATVVGMLGPEPLSADFTPLQFTDRLSGRSAAIKNLLLNQSILAGVGNIYADEALFAAGIDPRRPGGSLSEIEVDALLSAVRSVLRQGIELRGSSLQNYAPPTGTRGSFQEQHRVFRRTGQSCPGCGEPIQRIILGQRSTHFCPACQQ